VFANLLLSGDLLTSTFTGRFSTFLRHQVFSIANYQIFDDCKIPLKFEEILVRKSDDEFFELETISLHKEQWNIKVNDFHIPEQAGFYNPRQSIHQQQSVDHQQLLFLYQHQSVLAVQPRAQALQHPVGISPPSSSVIHPTSTRNKRYIRVTFDPRFLIYFDAPYYCPLEGSGRPCGSSSQSNDYSGIT
jgi:hypothetical protein